MRKYPYPRSLLRGGEGGCRLSPEAEMRPFPRDSAAQLFITETVSNFSCSFRSWFSAEAPAGGGFCFLFFF